MTPEDPDLPLVQALLLGEDRALNVLMDRHREGLFRFVLRHVHNEADALELAMETFVRAYFNIGKFRPAAKFATWLYHIALNLCRATCRRRTIAATSVIGLLIPFGDSLTLGAAGVYDSDYSY